MWYVDISVQRNTHSCMERFDEPFIFSSVEDAPAQMSDTEDFATAQETVGQHQESNTDIRITVKEEEEEGVNGKQNTVKSHFIN